MKMGIKVIFTFSKILKGKDVVIDGI